jgi:hypothetical protein
MAMDCKQTSGASLATFLLDAFSRINPHSLQYLMCAFQSGECILSSSPQGESEPVYIHSLHIALHVNGCP